ncbi:hypothetical protein [Paenibacillus sp. FSL R10-2788]
MGASASQLISVGQGGRDVSGLSSSGADRCKLVSVGQERIDVSWTQ